MHLYNIDVDDLIKRHQAGESIKQLAEAYGCSRNVLVNRLNKAGVVQRGRSESMYVRMTNTSLEERKRLVAKANQAARGRVCREEEKIKGAMTRFSRQLGISPYAVELASALEAVGWGSVLELPVGPYNLDLALVGSSVAVEIHGGGWHVTGRHAARRSKRLEYLLSLGWTVVEVWQVCRNWAPAGVAKQVVAIENQLGADPSTRGQHWVLRCDGNLAPALRSYGYDVPAVESSGRRDKTTGRYLRAA